MSRLSGLVLLMVLIAPMDTAIAKVNTGADGVAIHGYDVVAYFLEGRAVRGTSEFEHDWQDAKWQFSSAANKDLFAANPQRYVPQYGGFCATCLALDGELTDANPKAWTIVDGKLYLNYSMHQRTQWRIKSSIYVKYGDEVWAKLTLPAEVRKGVIEKSIGSGFKIAFLPLAIGNPGWTLALDTESEVKIRIKSYVEANESLELAYFYEAAPSGGPVIPPEQLWEGGYVSQQPVLESITRLAEQIGVQGVVTAYVRSATQALGVERASVDLYVIDINQGSVYEERGIVSDINEMLQKAFSNLFAALKRESSSYSDESYRIAVMKPAYHYLAAPTPNPNIIGDLGGDIYKSIRQQPSFSITHADEPVDPSALGYLNRGGDWPFPPTNVEPNEAWQGEMNHKKPNLERLYRAGQELELDAVVTWFYKPVWDVPQWPVEVYVIDVEKQRVYLHKGKNTEADALVRQAFDDFLAGREGYRIAVMQPAYFYPWGGAPSPSIVGSLGGDIYKSIRQQPSFSITHADEPVDPSALGYLNRGGDWPFPPTNVDPKEAWQGGIAKKTPNLDRLYRASDELGVDAVLMWHYRTISEAGYSDYPVEVYAIDVEKQRVYIHEGQSTGVEVLVRQALDDFLAGRER